MTSNINESQGIPTNPYKSLKIPKNPYKSLQIPSNAINKQYNPKPSNAIRYQ